jgi:hypothetical protein
VKILSRFGGVTIDGLWTGEWIYWYHSELQVIKAPPLISTLYKSLLQTLSLLHPAVCSTSRSLATASNSVDCSASRAQVLPDQWLSRNWTLPIPNSTIARSLLSFPCRAQTRLPILNWTLSIPNSTIALSLLSFPCRAQTRLPILNWTLSILTEPAWGFVIQPQGEPRRKHCPQQFFYCYGRLPSDCPDIVDVFSGRYKATHVFSRGRCIATVLHATI